MEYGRVAATKTLLCSTRTSNVAVSMTTTREGEFASESEAVPGRDGQGGRVEMIIEKKGRGRK